MMTLLAYSPGVNGTSDYTYMTSLHDSLHTILHNSLRDLHDGL